MRRLLRCCETVLEAAARTLYNGLFALADNVQIDRNGAGVDAVVRAAPCQRGHTRAGNHRFRGGTAHIDADPAKVVTLDEHHFAACLCEGNREESASMTGPNHNRIIAGCLCHPTLSLLLPPCTGAFASTYSSARTATGSTDQSGSFHTRDTRLTMVFPAGEERFLVPSRRHSFSRCRCHTTSPSGEFEFVLPHVIMATSGRHEALQSPPDGPDGKRNRSQRPQQFDGYEHRGLLDPQWKRGSGNPESHCYCR